MQQPGPRLLITGSRNWTDAVQMSEVLRDVWKNVFESNPETILVHGAARGADLMAKAIWEKRGLPTEAHPADWKKNGKSAGIKRNCDMVDLGADYLIAFLRPESKGARHCLMIAQMRDIPELVVWENDCSDLPELRYLYGHGRYGLDG